MRDLAIRYMETLVGVYIEPYVGSRGDPYDSALRRTVVGHEMTAVVRSRSHWRGLKPVEFAITEWGRWFNRHSLLKLIEYVSPDEHEEIHRYSWHPWTRGGTQRACSPE